MPGSEGGQSFSSPISRHQVVLKKHAAPSMIQLKHDKELLNDWYKTAENAIMYKDISLVNSVSKRIEEVSTRLINTYSKLLEWVPSGERHDDFQLQLQEVIQCKKEMEARIGQFQTNFKIQVGENIDVSSSSFVTSPVAVRTFPAVQQARSAWTSSSKSTHFSRSSTKTQGSTSSSVKRLEAKVRLEKAQVRSRHVEKTQQIEHEKQQLEHEKQKLEAQRQTLAAQCEIEEAEAEVKIWEAASNVSLDDGKMRSNETDIPKLFHNGLAEENEVLLLKPCKSKYTSPLDKADPANPSKAETVQPESAVVRGIMAAVGDAMSTPKTDSLKFHGEPMDYWPFIRSFEATIEKKAPSDRVKMNYLMNYCKGKAYSLIEHCTVMPPELGYAQAQSILYDNFGKPYIVSRAFVRQLTSGPNLKPDDSDGLQQFATSLRKCLLILKGLGNFSDLNTTDRLVELVLKLPYNSQNLWKRRAATILREKGEEANFQHLVEFVEEEAEVANTVFAKLLVPRKREERKPQDKPPKKSSVHTVVTKANRAPTQTRFTKSVSKCLFCSQSHSFVDCPSLKKKSVSERANWFREKYLCFNCLNPGHIAKQCKEAVTCSVEGCGRKHHALLHLPTRSASAIRNPDARNVSSSVSDVPCTGKVCCNTSKNGRSAYMSVLPVKFVANGREFESYAFLDIGSDATFCHTKLIEKLGLKGKFKRIQMDTLGRRPKMLEGIGVDLQVVSMDGNEVINIEEAMSVDHIPVSPYSYPTDEDLQSLPHLKGLEMPKVDSEEIMLLIGTDTPYAHRTLEIRTGGKKEPFAARTPLGWSLIGPSPDKGYVQANRIRTLELDQRIQRSWYQDFCEEPGDLQFPTSKEDRKVLKFMKEEVKHVDGHFVLPLPKRNSVKLPGDNLVSAQKRLLYLQRRLQKDDFLCKGYVERIQEYIDKGYAEQVPTEELQTSDPTWYLPHHPVYHPHKPDKVRVVFDCAATQKGVSLNDSLMQGPDLVNSLVSVLTRFRKNQIAIVGDVEAMFHQVRVKKSDSNLLRFLWWPEGDLTKKPTVHRMLVHIFGATSSPCMATFCLKHTTEEFGHEFDKHVSEIVKHNFYVDDCLASAPTEEEAIKTVFQLCKLLQRGGFRLTKWISNSQAVLDRIPETEIAKSMKDISPKESVKERVLGVYWNVFEDKFGFRTRSYIDEQRLTRRRLLSVINSLYDPLGFAAPVVLVAKRIQQEVIQLKLGWDDTIPEFLSEKWKKWCGQLPELKQLLLPRCLNPPDFGRVIERQIHHFCDASVNGYGFVTYLRQEDENHCVYCSFLCGKSKVTPPKSESIPRLELVAAVLAVKADKWLHEHLDYPDCKSTFWTDSSAVLFSISNERKRFSTFVANRLSKIHQQTTTSQWRHVGTKQNPADEASRGISVKKLLGSSLWLKGPRFLQKHESSWPCNPALKECVPDEFKPIEVKKSMATCCSTINPVDTLINRFSSLFKLKKAVAWILRYKLYLHSKKTVQKGKLTVEEILQAELELVKYVQRSAFPIAFEALSNLGTDQKGRRWLKKSNQTKCLNKLNPQLISGVLRLGGRLDNAPIPFESRHPIILPSNHHLTKLIITHYHEQGGHSGTAHTWTAIRQKYWIVKGGAAVRRALVHCIPCRKRNVPRSQQLMADLPPARLKPNEPPFSYTGIDFFGPFLVKRGRSEVKRYGCIFTCMTMRAVHIEVAEDLSTDSFINALRRFIARRGKPVEIYSDNGTNFVGAERVLREALEELNKEKLEAHLQQKGIKWAFNPPAASHMGGIWERLIRSIRKILNSMLHKSPIISEDTLRTLMVEVENILNSRPLTPVTFSPSNDVPLTPNHILLQKPSPIMAPGQFDEKDNYTRRRWRQVQFLADEFWRRWTNEYLPTIALRQKWPDRRKNIEVGDIVLVVNESMPRRGWDLGRVINTYPDKHGVVRQVDVKTKSNIIKRPIAKLCLVFEASGSQVHSTGSDN